MNNIIFNKYAINLQVVKNLYRGSKETLQGGSKETLHNNNNLKINNISNQIKLHSRNVVASNTNEIDSPPKMERTKKRNPSTQLKVTKPSKVEKSKQFIPLSTKLAETITSNKKIHITPSKLNAWAMSIQTMVDTDKIEPSRIEKALDWYENNIGGDYVPVIECGRSLRDKFIKLENAMTRKKFKPYDNSKPSNGTITVTGKTINYSHLETKKTSIYGK